MKWCQLWWSPIEPPGSTKMRLEHPRDLIGLRNIYKIQLDIFGILWISLFKKNMVSFVDLFIPMNTSMHESPWWHTKFFTLPSLSRWEWLFSGQFSDRIDHWCSSLEFRAFWKHLCFGGTCGETKRCTAEKNIVVLWKRLGSWLRVWDIRSRYLGF